MFFWRGRRGELRVGIGVGLPERSVSYEAASLVKATGDRLTEACYGYAFELEPRRLSECCMLATQTHPLASV